MTFLLPLLIVAIHPAGEAEARYSGAKTVFECAFDKTWDENFDGWPDNWTRRRGPDYPHYVSIKISDEPSPVGDRCLRIEPDGAGAVAYSPPIEVGWLYSYVLQGQLKTEGLSSDEAYFSITFLDQKRHRLASYETEKIGRTDGWKTLRVGPIEPRHKDVAHAVIGLHLQAGSVADLKGAALFDDVWLGRLPRMSLSVENRHNVFTDPNEIEIKCNVSGFTQKSPRVEFQLEDVHGRVLARTEHPLKVRRAAAGSVWSSDGLSDEASGQVGRIAWKPPVKGPGFYRVRAKLTGSASTGSASTGSASTCSRDLTLAVIHSLGGSPGGEFGWSLPEGGRPLPLSVLGRLLGQVGVGWVKYPLWYGERTSEERIEELIQFSERLSGDGIELVGMLDRPPAEIRDRFGDANSLEAADIFTSDPRAWYPSLEPVLTRLSTRVQWWQLGRDTDTSFVGCLRLEKKLSEIKKELDRVGQGVNLGIGWGWIDELPGRRGQTPSLRFLTLSADPPLTHQELSTYLKGSQPSGDTSDDPLDGRVRRWVGLRPLSRDDYAIDVRAADLVRRMMAAKIHAADGVFVSDPVDTRRGLLNDDGTPGELLLAWRTAALALGGSEYLGSLELPGGSPNQVFSRADDAVMVVWNDKPVEEVIYLGEDARQFDVWGRGMTPEKREHRQVIHVGPMPTFVVGLNEPIARWRMDCSFAKDAVPSVPGKPHQNAFRVKNHFLRGAGGQAGLIVPDLWQVDPRQTTFRLAAGNNSNCRSRFCFPTMRTAAGIRFESTSRFRPIGRTASAFIAIWTWASAA